MREADFKAVARAAIRWLTRDEGGRQSPPPGPIFAATARFDSDVLDRDLSIVMRLGEQSPGVDEPIVAEIGFLAPELIADRLEAGLRFSILEGPRTVAEGRVLELFQASR